MITRLTILILLLSVTVANAQQWEWAKFSDSTTSLQSYSKLTIDDNHYIYQSVSHLGSPPFASITKLDENGNQHWKKEINGKIQIRTIKYFENFIYLVGSFVDTIQIENNILYSNGLEDIFITKYTLNGDCLWTKQWGGSNDDFGYDIDLDHDGNIYIAGSFYNNITFGDTTYTVNGTVAFIAITDTAGNLISSKIFQSSIGWCAGQKIKVDLSKNIFLLGVFHQDITLDSIYFSPDGQTYNFLCKIDSTGMVRWAERLAGYSCGINSIAIDSSSNIFTTGTCHGNHGGGRIETIKYNLYGVQQWSNSIYAGAPDGIAVGEIATDGHNTFIIGYQDHHNGFSQTICYQKLIIAKYNMTGNLEYFDTLRSSGTNCSNIYRPTLTIDKHSHSVFIGATYRGGIKFGNDSLITITPQIILAKLADETIITHLDSSNSITETKVYPIPSSGIVNISLNKNHLTKISVIDMYGNCIIKQECSRNSNEQIDLSKVAKGIYTVEIISDRKREVRKVVLN